MFDFRPVGDGHKNETKCCSGLCIDLLTKFEDELGFTYDLVRTPDPKWGTFEVKSYKIYYTKLCNRLGFVAFCVNLLRYGSSEASFFTG